MDSHGINVTIDEPSYSQFHYTPNPKKKSSIFDSTWSFHIVLTLVIIIVILLFIVIWLIFSKKEEKQQSFSQPVQFPVYRMAYREQSKPKVVIDEIKESDPPPQPPPTEEDNKL